MMEERLNFQTHFKNKHGEDVVLLFAVGETYEAYRVDAFSVNNAIGKTNLKRIDGVDVSVIGQDLTDPIRKMIAAGLRVGIVDDLKEAEEML